MSQVITCVFTLLIVTACLSKRRSEETTSLELGSTFLVNDENTSLYAFPKKKQLITQLESLQSDLQDDKQNIEIMHRIVDTLFFLKRYQEAIDFGKKILFIDDTDKQIRLKMAHIAVRMRKFAYAEFILSRLACNKSSDCTNLRGVVAYNMEQTKEALTYFTNALALDRKNTAASLNLAFLYMEYFKFDDATREVSKILRILPNDKHAKLIQATLAARQKKYEKAIDILEDLHDEDQNNPVVLHNLSANYLLMGDYQRAMSFINKALKAAPQYSFKVDKSISLKEEIALKKRSRG